MGRFVVHRCDWCRYSETEPELSGGIQKVNFDIAIAKSTEEETPHMKFIGDLCHRCRMTLVDYIRMARNQHTTYKDTCNE